MPFNLALVAEIKLAGCVWAYGAGCATVEGSALAYRRALAAKQRMWLEQLIEVVWVALQIL
jgi:hypothetical protein